MIFFYLFDSDLIFKFYQYRWKYFLSCDLISIVFTLCIVEYRVLSRGLILVLYFRHSVKFLRIFYCQLSAQNLALLLRPPFWEWVRNELWMKKICQFDWPTGDTSYFSTHKGACSWNRLVQQICCWSLLQGQKGLLRNIFFWPEIVILTSEMWINKLLLLLNYYYYWISFGRITLRTRTWRERPMKQNANLSLENQLSVNAVCVKASSN